MKMSNLGREQYLPENAKKIEEQFAMERIWIRTFDYSDKWVRIGIPGKDEEWERADSKKRDY